MKQKWVYRHKGCIYSHKHSRAEIEIDTKNKNKCLFIGSEISDLSSEKNQKFCLKCWTIPR